MTLVDLAAGWTMVEPYLSRGLVLFCACHDVENCHRALLIEQLHRVYGIETHELP